MTARIALQPSGRTDGITSDGRELIQRPYPYHVDAEGNIGRQDFWNGEPALVVGFTRDPNLFELHFRWAEVWANPALCVGMYPVTANTKGEWSTNVIAIESATPNSEYEAQP